MAANFKSVFTGTWLVMDSANSVVITSWLASQSAYSQAWQTLWYPLRAARLVSVALVNSVERVLRGQVQWKREGKLLKRVFKGQELHLLVDEKGWTCENTWRKWRVGLNAHFIAHQLALGYLSPWRPWVALRVGESGTASQPKLTRWFRMNFETWILFFAEDMYKKHLNAVTYCLV